MNLVQIIALLLTLAAAFSYVNHRFVKLPVTIGVMLIALVMSLALIVLGKLGADVTSQAEAVLSGIDFDDTLLQGFLSFLLFAGALHIDLSDLSKQKGIVTILATVGLLISTLVIAFLLYWILPLVGVQVPLIYCLLFGALISPTDPIAVIAILRSAHVPASVETTIAGESLFNDGVGVVVFLTFLEVLRGSHEVTLGFVTALFLQEAVGGILFGLAIGYLAYRMLRSIDQYQVEVLITLALVAGGYTLASALHVSGPIAIVVAGLMIGNQGRTLAMSDVTRDHLDKFWELVDEILNAVLFVLIGLEILVVHFGRSDVAAALLTIPIVLGARWISVAAPIMVMKRFRRFTPGAITILTWGGLRGGISVALALSLPAGPNRDVLLGVTYAVVVFSIVVQGLSVGTLVKRLMARGV
ncbi:MAG: sodium:proton antiporter [Thermoanaerobaculia bacterium]|jgi:CPA1 family monovalent cation:H+ antiporter